MLINYLFISSFIDPIEEAVFDQEDEAFKEYSISGQLNQGQNIDPMKNGTERESYRLRL
jgi:hypothetical protein